MQGIAEESPQPDFGGARTCNVKPDLCGCAQKKTRIDRRPMTEDRLPTSTVTANLNKYDTMTYFFCWHKD